MNDDPANRRRFLGAAAAGAALAAGGAFAAEKDKKTEEGKSEEKEVGANEDLMREHGVLRRALLVYRAAAERLRGGKDVPAEALHRTAQLFRAFGEDYHERQLEERFIFPAVRKLDGPAAAYPDVLQAQHERGRELTDYVMRVTHGEKIAGGDAAPLSRALDSFERMYEHHAAREDTIVFVAWKKSLSKPAYDDMSERFEEIEKRIFGHDGFEEAVHRIAAIESRFGLTDISQFKVVLPG